MTPWPGHRPPAHPSAGETLVETLVTVSILGVIAAAVIGALATGISLSTTHRQQASASVVIRSAAESVNTQAYVSCQTVSTSSYQPTLGVTVPAGWSVTVTAVRYWDPIQASFVAGNCAQDSGLELVTVLGVSPDNRARATLDIVKRQPT